MLVLVAGDVRPASAFLLFVRGLMEGAGDGASRGGLGGYRDPGSLTVSGAAPCSALSSVFVSRHGEEGFCDVLPHVFWRVSL